MSWEHALPAGESFAAFLVARAAGGESEAHAPPAQTLGEEMHHIHPLILGGDPESADNLINVSRQGHVELVRWWNRLIRDVASDDERPGGGLESTG